MAKIQSPKVLRPKFEKFVKNAGKRAKQLKKVSGTKSGSFFSSRLKKADAKSAKKARLLAELVRADKDIVKLYTEMSKAYYANRERCDGYLTRGEMSDLFGR